MWFYPELTLSGEVPATEQNLDNAQQVGNWLYRVLVVIVIEHDLPTGPDPAIIHRWHPIRQGQDKTDRPGPVRGRNRKAGWNRGTALRLIYAARSPSENRIAVGVTLEAVSPPLTRNRTHDLMPSDFVEK